MLKANESNNDSPLTTSSPLQTSGGIDLDADYLNLDTRKQKFTQVYSNLAYSLDSIEGFTFAISSIKGYP